MPAGPRGSLPTVGYGVEQVIYGIGTDIVHVPRMQANLARFGERFARRMLNERELQDFRLSAKPAHFLAKRFAAKEAAVKAIGLGFRRGLGLRDIGVRHDRNGRPELEYSARALALLRELGIGDSHLSLADEAEHAIAFVTLLQRR